MTRIVKIAHHRGHGDGLWKVVSEHGSGSRAEYELNNEDGNVVRIYKAHCYNPTVAEIKAVYGWPPR